jgi:hypothetical protein
LKGGYKKGSTAQEEDLFRRTTLSSALDTEFGSSMKYPMDEFSPVLTRDVSVFRGPENEGCHPEANPLLQRFQPQNKFFVFQY